MCGWFSEALYEVSEPRQRFLQFLDNIKIELVPKIMEYNNSVVRHEISTIIWNLIQKDYILSNYVEKVTTNVNFDSPQILTIFIHLKPERFKDIWHSEVCGLKCLIR